MPNPPSTGNTELDAYLRSVRDAINTAAKPVAGWKLSDFHASVSEVISEERDLIDIVTAWDDIVKIRNDFRVEVERYEALYSDSKTLGGQYEDYADTFSQIMEWWDQNVLLIEEVQELVGQIHTLEETARDIKTSETNAKTSETNAKTSETNAGNSASSASSSASSAASSATTATGAASTATGAASTATGAASTATSSASAADSAATRAEDVADSTHWQGDRLSVMGQLGPSLKGPKGDKGDAGEGTGDVLWAEIDPVLSGKADKTYVDTELGNKASSSHQHPVTDITATGTRSATTYLRGDGSWTTPTNTTYSVPTQAEAEAGTATTGRAFSAQRVAQAIDARAAAKTHTHTPGEIGAAPSHVEVTGDWPTTGTPGVIYWKAE